MNHTPTRYYADNGRIFSESSDAHSIQIASYGSSASRLPDSEQTQMGDRIARALNYHEELLAALQALFSYTIDVLTGPRFEGVTWPDDFPDSHRTLKNAKAAIHNATKNE